MPKREDINGRWRPDENELVKRYRQIGIKSVAAAVLPENEVAAAGATTDNNYQHVATFLPPVEKSKSLMMKVARTTLRAGNSAR